MKIQRAAAAALTGTIELPGDKSIAHRAALLAALARGETRIENFATSRDCQATLACLERLGVRIDRTASGGLVVRGRGKNGFTAPADVLDCGNSGTTMRLLAGVLAGQPFDSVLIGDGSLSRRPMGRIIEPLVRMDARIEAAGDPEAGCAPLHIRGRPSSSGSAALRAAVHRLPVASAQVKSCLLLAGLYAAGRTVVESPPTREPVPASRDHTEIMLRYLGAGIEEEFVETAPGEYVHRTAVSGDAELTARDLRIPGDISSAAFFAAAAAGLPGSDILLRQVGLNPTRTAFFRVLRDLGAETEITGRTETGGEPVGDIRVRGRTGRLAPADGSNIIGGELIPHLIDEIPILAVFGTRISGGLEIRDAAELRVKESDRIRATVENLRRMNARAEEFPDGLRVHRADLRGTRIDSFDDHRIAMAFAVAGLFAEGTTEIAGAEDCAAVSFPGFFETLARAVAGTSF